MNILADVMQLNMDILLHFPTGPLCVASETRVTNTSVRGTKLGCAGLRADLFQARAHPSETEDSRAGPNLIVEFSSYHRSFYCRENTFLRRTHTVMGSTVTDLGQECNVPRNYATF